MNDRQVAEIMRAAADASPERLRELVVAHPGWLRADVRQKLASAADLRSRALADRLAAEWSAVMSDPQPLWDPSSPLIKLWTDVDIGISFADALGVAASPAVADQLVEPYAVALAALVEEVASDVEQISAARVLLELMVAAASASAIPESPQVRSRVDRALLTFALMTLPQVLDPTLFRRAIDACQRSIDQAAAEHDRDRLVVSQGEMAVLLTEPYLQPATPYKVAAVRRALDRAIWDPRVPAFQEDAIQWVLDINGRLDEGLVWADRALGNAGRDTRAEVSFIKLSIMRRAVGYGRPLDERLSDDLVRASSSIALERDLIKRVTYLTAIAPRENSRLRDSLDELLRLLAAHTDLPTVTEGGIQRVGEVVVGAVEAIDDETDQERKAIEIIRPLVPQFPDMLRFRALRAELRLLVASLVRRSGVSEYVPALTHARSTEDVTAVLGRSSAGDARRSRENRAALLLFAGLLPTPEAEPSVPLGWINEALAAAPDLLEPHRDAIRAEVAAAFASRFDSAARANDHAMAIECQEVSINTFASLELIDYVEDSLAMVDYWRREVGEAADPYLTQLVTTELAMIGPMLPDSARRRLRGLGDGTLERPDSLVPELAAALVASIDGSRLGSVVYAGPSSVTDETRGLVEELLRTHDRADDRPLPAEDKQRELELLVPQRGYLDEEGRPTRVRARQLHERSIDERLWRAAIVPTSVPLVTLDSISGQLGPEDAAIIFHVSPNALSYAVVHQGTPWIMQQPSIPGALRVRATDSWVTISGLEMEILQTRSLIQEDPGPFDVSSDGRAQLQRIGDGFFAEIERYLVELEEHGVEHLCIVAGNPLLMLPFHLAIVARRPLVDRFRISYASNWRLVGRASRATRPVRVTAFGVSGGGELPGLPDAPEEARRIASACGGRAITDERVTVEAIRAALTSSRYVHIAAHGGQIPYASALHWVQTGEQDGSGRLRAADILDLDLRGLELVTLSTCESATLVFDEFGDPRGIAATLFARGAQAVVGTLWPIESTASQDFFERLYAGVGTGRAPFDAFSEAQRATRGDHPQSRDWGAFFYSGRW